MVSTAPPKTPRGNLDWKKAAISSAVLFGSYLVYAMCIKKAKTPEADFAKESAKVTCKCGKVEVNIRGNTRYTLECCCCDCLQKIEWAISKGCPIDKACLKNGFKLSYFGNAIASIKDEELMKTYMLRSVEEKGASIFSVAECCSSIMMIDHPKAYGGASFMILHAGCNLTSIPMASQARIQSMDRHPSKDPETTSWPLPPGEGPDMLLVSLIRTFMNTIQAPPRREAGDKTVQEVQGKTPTTVLGLTNYAHVKM
mmetsp:Transcript_17992/g.18203  ORF Transcript_17992/g.18203 Transcript_17992/m.18203 type:complete len:255 (-) Transcript_17992:336-1100(-)